MRTSAKFSTAPTACENGYDGEVEDYRIIVANTVGVSENVFGTNLIVYPNPTNGNFSIDLGSNHQSVRVTITDIAGRTVQSNTYKESHTLNLKLSEPAGVYILLVESGDEKVIIRLLKE